MLHVDWSLRALGTALLALASNSVTTEPARLGAPVTIALASSSVVGGVGTRATITLASAAPAGGTIITVASAPPVTIRGGANQVSLVGQIGPTSIRVPGGATQVTIGLSTAGVANLTTSTITAKSGSDSSIATLTIRPASIVSMSVSPTTVTGGQSPSLHIILDGAAPGGTGVDAPLLVSHTPAFADGSVRTIEPSLTGNAPGNAPAIVHFPPGSSTLTVPFATNPVARDESLMVTIRLGKSASAGLTIKAPVVTSVSLRSSVVVAGDATQATLALSGPAPAGFVVRVAASRADVTVSSPVAVREGSASAVFNVSTSPTTATSSPVTATVGVPGASPAALAPISDGTSNTIALGELPSSASATLSIVPRLVLRSATASPSPVVGGTPIILALGFGTAATQVLGGSPGTAVGSPSAISEGTASISVDQPSIVHLPASIDVASNTLVLPVKGTTTPPPSDATITIKTTFRDKTFATVVQVNAPPPSLELFALRPTVLKGGTNVLASLKLPSTATSSRVVALSTDHPELISLPPSVTVPVSPVATPFTFRTQPTSSETIATVTAAVGAEKISVRLTITP